MELKLHIVNIPRNDEDSFNCTFMELKWRITQSRQSALAGFNCTFMELKFSKGFGM